MIKFCGKERVIVQRTFSVARATYAEVVIQKNGVKKIVGINELTDEPVMVVLDEFLDKKTATLDEIEIDSGETFVSISDFNVENLRAKVVVATNMKTDKTETLGELGELAESDVVAKLKLDPEAINRCLNGEQKQHKGYTFHTV